jgi:hypothetical protein
LQMHVMRDPAPRRVRDAQPRYGTGYAGTYRPARATNERKRNATPACRIHAASGRRAQGIPRRRRSGAHPLQATCKSSALSRLSPKLDQNAKTETPSGLGPRLSRERARAARPAVGGRVGPAAHPRRAPPVDAPVGARETDETRRAATRTLQCVIVHTPDPARTHGKARSGQSRAVSWRVSGTTICQAWSASRTCAADAVRDRRAARLRASSSAAHIEGSVARAQPWSAQTATCRPAHQRWWVIPALVGSGTRAAPRASAGLARRGPRRAAPSGATPTLAQGMGTAGELSHYWCSPHSLQESGRRGGPRSGAARPSPASPAWSDLALRRR